MFRKRKRAVDRTAEYEARLSAAAGRLAELEACVRARDERINALQGILAVQPWARRHDGISGGTYHSDPGTETSWAKLDERIEQEACSFRNHAGYKAIVDLLEARLLGIWRRWRATDDRKEILSLHIHARVYEDMLAVLEGKTSLRERKEAHERLVAKAAQESDRHMAMAAAGRSPFVR